MSRDPKRYLLHPDQRALPFRHLVAAVGHLTPDVVVDLGCGPGGLTAPLCERCTWRVQERPAWNAWHMYHVQ